MKKKWLLPIMFLALAWTVSALEEVNFTTCINVSNVNNTRYVLTEPLLVNTVDACLNFQNTTNVTIDFNNQDWNYTSCGYPCVDINNVYGNMTLKNLHAVNVKPTFFLRLSGKTDWSDTYISVENWDVVNTSQSAFYFVTNGGNYLVKNSSVMGGGNSELFYSETNVSYIIFDDVYLDTYRFLRAATYPHNISIKNSNMTVYERPILIDDGFTEFKSYNTHYQFTDSIGNALTLAHGGYVDITNNTFVAQSVFGAVYLYDCFDENSIIRGNIFDNFQTDFSVYLSNISLVDNTLLNYDNVLGMYIGRVDYDTATFVTDGYFNMYDYVSDTFIREYVVNTSSGTPNLSIFDVWDSDDRVTIIDNGAFYDTRQPVSGAFNFSILLSYHNITIVPNSAPLAPVLSSPLNDTDFNFSHTTIPLQWSASSDFENDSVYYEVYLGQSSPSSLVGNVSSTELNVSGLDTSTFFWMARATDGLNSSDSESWLFRTHYTTPGVILKNPLSTVTGSNTISFEVETNEQTTCKYDDSYTDYYSLPSFFDVTGGYNHSQTLVLPNSAYVYTVACLNDWGAVGTDNLTIVVAVEQSDGGRPGGGGGTVVVYPPYTNYTEYFSDLWSQKLLPVVDDFRSITGSVVEKQSVKFGIEPGLLLMILVFLLMISIGLYYYYH